MSDNCPTCEKMAEARIRANPSGYEALARRQPGARLKLCPECIKTSKIHGADGSFATQDPIDPTEAARQACEERRKGIFLGVVFIFAGIAAWLKFGKKKKA